LSVVLIEYKLNIESLLLYSSFCCNSYIWNSCFYWLFHGQCCINAD